MEVENFNDCTINSQTQVKSLSRTRKVPLDQGHFKEATHNEAVMKSFPALLAECKNQPHINVAFPYLLGGRETKPATQ